MMEFPLELVMIFVGFVILVNRLVAAVITPLFDKFKWDKFWVMYVAWALAGLAVWLADLNVFGEFVADPLTGKIMTALITGGGANILYDLTDNQPNG